MSDYSDSDSDYNENEKILLDKYRKRKRDSDDEDEEGVFNVAPDEDDSDDDEDILADSDIEGQEEQDDLPSDIAWGRSSKAYYSSDYVNPKTTKEKELEFAEFEGDESKKLHNEMHEMWTMLNVESQEVEEEIYEDPKERETKLAKDDKELLSNLINDFKEYISIYNEYMKPVIERYRNNAIENSPLTEFVECFSSLILNYSTNIFMYLLLKSNKTPIIHHPILKRLEEYQQLVQKMLPVFQKTVRAKIEQLLLKEEDTNIIESVKPKKKKLKILQNLVLNKSVEKQKKPKVEKIKQKVQFADKDEIYEIENDQEIDRKENCQEIDHEENDQEIDETVQQSDALEKRPITYQMAKNKGLTPRRKKEQRNPRVKHRNKYKKAKVRRKGAVREVRTEGRRYDGEISGIKTNVMKGIKIKV